MTRRPPGPRRRSPGASPPRSAGGESALYGINAVQAALQAQRRPLGALHLKSGAGSPALDGLRELALELGLTVREQAGEELERLSRNGHHQGAVLQCGPLPLLDETAALAHGAGWRERDSAASTAAFVGPPLLVALDQVEDPRNLGAVVRAADAFGAAGLVLPRDHSAPLSPAASSASAGALERFPVHTVPNLARFCEQAKAGGFWVLGTHVTDGVPLAGYRHDRPLVLVLGNEGRGLRPLVARACDQHLTIPLASAERGGSLNVASAAAVLLYHLLGAR